MRTNKEIIQVLEKLANDNKYNCNILRDAPKKIILVFSPVQELLRITVEKSSNYTTTIATSKNLAKHFPILQYDNVDSSSFDDTETTFKEMLDTVGYWLQNNQGPL